MAEPAEIGAIRAKLAAHRSELERLHVRSLKVFGSRARGEARPDSDLDMIAEFSASVGFFELFDVERYLSDLLERKVELTTPGGLHPALKPRILKDAIEVA
jgi:uncharacterized protein